MVYSVCSGVSPNLQALNSVPMTEGLWKNCLNALRQICGDRAILPTTHVLSRGLIKRGNASLTPHDANYWEAHYKRRAVRVRRLQTSPASEPEFMKVHSYYVCVIVGHALTYCKEILSRGRALEEIESPEHHLCTGRDDRPVSSCLR
jgi:hypothetical protein